MDYKGYRNLTNTQFADRAGIPRPTLSQFLTGRNKRLSDDMAAKIHNAFPDLNMLWLLFGEGEMLNDPNIGLSEGKSAQNSSVFVGQDVVNEENGNDVDPQNQGVAKSGIYENRSLFDTNEYDRGGEATASGREGAGIGLARKDNKPVQAEGVRGGCSNEQPNAGKGCGRLLQNVGLHRGAAEAGRKGGCTMVQPYAQRVNSTQGEQPFAERAGSNASSEATRAKKVQSIMVFYSDSSFEIFTPTGE